MSMHVDPHRTQAFVVGINRYDVGENWGLKGPVEDACRFASWLRQHDVPSNQVHLFLSPQECPLDLPEIQNIKVKEAELESFQTALTDLLRQSDKDLFFLYWGGHGIMTKQGTRRLFYADASEPNKKNLNLDRLLSFLRSDYFNAAFLRHQIVIVDACASYAERMGWTNDLPDQSFPDGPQVVSGREQFVLFSAESGAVADNLQSKRTGRFSEMLQSILEEQSSEVWPPVMEKVTQQVFQRFSELRKIGETHQRPIRLRYRDWQGNEDETSVGKDKLYAAEATRQLSFHEKKQLADAFLSCRSMRNRSQRNTIVNQLSFAHAVEEKARPDKHVFDIVETALDYNFQELYDVVRSFEENSLCMSRLNTLLEKLLPEVKI